MEKDYEDYNKDTDFIYEDYKECVECGYDGFECECKTVILCYKCKEKCKQCKKNKSTYEQQLIDQNKTSLTCVYCLQIKKAHCNYCKRPCCNSCFGTCAYYTGLSCDLFFNIYCADCKKENPDILEPDIFEPDILQNCVFK